MKTALQLLGVVRYPISCRFENQNPMKNIPVNARKRLIAIRALSFI